MQGFFTAAIAALPNAAQSWPALCAYALTVAAYVLAVWRVSRNKNLLLNIKGLPARDRLAALEIEMAGARLSSGMTPEAWIKLRTRRYILIAVLATLLTMLIVFGVALFERGKPSVDISLYDRPQSDPPNSVGKSRQQHYLYSLASADDLTVRYQAIEENGELRIFPQTNFIDIERRENLVKSVELSPTFHWHFPELSFKVSNNSSNTLLISEIRLRVKKSSIDRRAIPIVGSPGNMGMLTLKNEGWGAMRSAAVSFNVGPLTRCATSDYPSYKNRVALPDIGTPASISIKDYLTPALLGTATKCESKIYGACAGDVCTMDSQVLAGVTCIDKTNNPVCSTVNRKVFASDIVRTGRRASVDSLEQLIALSSPKSFYRNCTPIVTCVEGEVSYLDSANKHMAMRFKSIVTTGEPDLGLGRPPSYTYDVRLEAGNANYTRSMSVSQEIRAGETDQFLARVATDKTANFIIDCEVLSASGAVLTSKKIDLTVFVPA